MKKLYALCAMALIIPMLFLPGCRNSESSDLKIGILMPLTGKNAVFGVQTRNGAKMFIDEYNSAGGLNGKQISYVEYDEEGDASKAVVGYNFLKDDGCSAIITGAASATSLAVAPVSYEDGIPMMITTASADGITYDKENKILYKNVFRVGFTNSFQAETMAQFAKGNGAKNVAVFFSAEDDYSSGLNEKFIKKCESLKINVNVIENFSMNTVDFSSQLGNIKEKNPDMIFIPSYYEIVGLIVQQARKMAISCPMIGTDSWSGITKSVSDLSALENCFYCSSYSPEDPSELSQKFSENYEKRFGEAPNMLAAGGYDAAKILIAAMESSLNQGLEINSDEFKNSVVNALKLTNISCVAGDISYDEFNNPKKQAVILNIKNGKEKFYKKL